MKALIFVLVNIIIIAGTELTGTLFFNKGVIHAIALIFVFVAAIPLARNYYLADPIFKKFLTASIFAFILFSVSHISEYFLFSLHAEYVDFIFAIAINFYLASILLMILGSEIFIRAYSGYRHSRAPMAITGIVIAALVSFSFFLSVNSSAISLEPDSITPYLYGAGTIVIAFLFWKRLSRLKASLNRSFLSFFRLLGAMLILVIISSFLYAFYELIEEMAGIPEYQIVYFSHFFFYGGLSLMFLAFEELLKIGGVAKDIREFLKNKNNKINNNAKS